MIYGHIDISSHRFIHSFICMHVCKHTRSPTSHATFSHHIKFFFSPVPCQYSHVPLVASRYYNSIIIYTFFQGMWYKYCMCICGVIPSIRQALMSQIWQRRTRICCYFMTTRTRHFLCVYVPLYAHVCMSVYVRVRVCVCVCVCVCVHTARHRRKEFCRRESSGSWERESETVSSSLYCLPLFLLSHIICHLLPLQYLMQWTTELHLVT